VGAGPNRFTASLADLVRAPRRPLCERAVAPARPIVDLAEKFVPRFPDGLAEIGPLGFGEQVIAPIVELNDDVMFRDVVPALDPYLRDHFFFEVLQPSIDLIEIALDAIDVR
jgi:hypothetical protein